MPGRSARPRTPPAPPPPTGEARHEWPLALVLAVVTWAVLFHAQLFLGQACTLGDAGAFRPFAEFSRARWRAEHVRTYWNPYTFMGMESVASLSDSRPQYLPDAALDLVERLSQPRRSPQFWLLLAHLLGTLSVMMLARRLWRARGVAALCGGLVWLLSVPILLPFAFGHDAQFLADALTPVVVLFGHRLVTGPGGRRMILDLLALASTLAIQVLHGHPQIAIYAWTFLAAFALQQALVRRKPASLAGVAAAAGLALAMSAAVWWPALRFSAQSFRGGGETPGLSLLEVAKYSLGWRDLLSLAWPHAVGYGGATYWGSMRATDYSPYLGAVVIALAVLGRKGWSAHRSTVALLACTVGLAVLLSLGTTLGPAFGVLREWVPMWSKFRVPFYLLVLACLGLALLAARGASAPDPPPAPPTARARALVIGAFALAGLLALALMVGPLERLVADLARAAKPTIAAADAHQAARTAGRDLLLRLALVGAAVVVARPPHALRSGIVRWALPLLIVVDLGGIAYPALSRSVGPLSAVDAPRPTPLADVAATDPLSRAYVGVGHLFDGRYNESYTNFWVSWRARCLTGLAGAPPTDWRRVTTFELTRRGAVLRAWGVRFFDLAADVATPDTAISRLVLEREGIRVFAFNDALGRAYAVPYVVAVPGEDAVARAMAAPGFDPGFAAVVTDGGAAGEYPGSDACVVRWVRDDPEHLELEVDAPDRAFVVVADSHFPGWSATVNGSPARIVQTNLLVRGIAVAPGRHRIVMRYETVGMRVGVACTRLAWLVWLLLLAAWLVVASRQWMGPGRRRGGI